MLNSLILPLLSFLPPNLNWSGDLRIPPPLLCSYERQRGMTSINWIRDIDLNWIERMIVIRNFIMKINIWIINYKIKLTVIILNSSVKFYIINVTIHDFEQRSNDIFNFHIFLKLTFFCQIKHDVSLLSGWPVAEWPK